jgi:hypothetical protein
MEVAFALFFVAFLEVVLAVDIFSALIAGIKAAAAAASESSTERSARAAEDKERPVFVLSIWYIAAYFSAASAGD